MRYQYRKRNFITLFLGVISLIFFYFNFKKSSGKVREIRRNETALFLDNILYNEDQIELNKGIFFIDTTRMKNPEKPRRLTNRQACAIESAALTNPSNKIFIILVSSIPLNAVEFTEEMEILLTYPNVYPMSLNLVEFSIDTPFEHFIANGSIFNSIFIKSHVSDALRLLLLWKYGGTYIDTDMIVRLELNQLPSNYICKDHGYLNGAIVNLDTKLGKKFSKIFIENFIENFNGSEWGEKNIFFSSKKYLKINF